MYLKFAQVEIQSSATSNFNANSETVLATNNWTTWIFFYYGKRFQVTSVEVRCVDCSWLLCCSVAQKVVDLDCRCTTRLKLMGSVVFLCLQNREVYLKKGFCCSKYEKSRFFQHP